MKLALVSIKEILKIAREKYIVKLTDEEHGELLELTRKGTARARKMKRALVLLKADEGLTDPEIMAAVNISRPCVERLRKRFVEGSLERALNEDPRPGQKRKFGSRGEAMLIAELSTLVEERNRHHATVHWQFRTQDARIKLKRLYPCYSD